MEINLGSVRAATLNTSVFFYPVATSKLFFTECYRVYMEYWMQSIITNMSVISTQPIRHWSSHTTLCKTYAPHNTQDPIIAPPLRANVLDNWTHRHFVQLSHWLEPSIGENPPWVTFFETRATISNTNWSVPKHLGSNTNWSVPPKHLGNLPLIAIF